MNKAISQEIINSIRTIIPNPKCELNYRNIFELLCAVMISSQTTDKRVNLVTPKLFEKYPTPIDMSKADFIDIYNIIRPIGFANNKAKNLINMSKKLVDNYNGIVPNTLEELQKLDGVGRKTASVILAEGFKIPAMPVDTHLERMSKRLGYSKKTDSLIKIEENYRKYIPKDEWIDAHHLLLLFGRYYCTAINPKCENCILKKYCKVE